MWTRRVTSIHFGTIVISATSIIIVVAVVYLLWRDGKVESIRPLYYALTSVLGFWFGKAVRNPKVDGAS